jgi:hypothetical protein
VFFIGIIDGKEQADRGNDAEGDKTKLFHLDLRELMLIIIIQR